MSELYTPAQRRLQDRHGTRPLADRLDEMIVTTALDDEMQAFVGSRDFFFLSTVDGAGRPTVSHKGGAPGFVRVRDARRLAFPAYDGNGMFLSLGNIAETARIGMLFIDFGTPHRLRLQASARLSEDAAALDDFPGAIAVVEATVDQAFVNCPRYVHLHARLAASGSVPDTAGRSPLATWKRIDAVQDVIAPADRARVAAEGGAIDIETYDDRLRRGDA